jgi:hypothetical protein
MAKSLTTTIEASWVTAQEPGRDVCSWVVDAIDMYALAVRGFGGGGGGDDMRKGVTVPARRRRECPHDD